MNAPELSMFVFGIYLIVFVGLGFVFIPNKVLAMSKQPTTNEPWIRVLGFIVALIGYYYIVVAQNGLTPLMWASVYARFSVLAFFIVMTLIKQTKASIIIFGAIDGAGAIWTLLTLL